MPGDLPEAWTVQPELFRVVLPATMLHLNSGARASELRPYCRERGLVFMQATTVELQAKPTQKPADTVPEVVIYFAGDSGDGIQAIGGQFGHTCVRMGNDI